MTQTVSNNHSSNNRSSNNDSSNHRSNASSTARWELRLYFGSLWYKA